MDEIKQADAVEADAIDTEGWQPPAPSVATRRPARSSAYAARVTVIAPDEREVLAECNLEANVAYALMADPRVAVLREQPAPVSYLDADGNPHMHTLDFIAILKDGTKVGVLVKPAEIARRRETNEFVKLLARQVPSSVADRFVLLTEDEVDRDRVHDAKLINAARLHPRPEQDAALRRIASTLNGPVTIATLVKMSGLGGDGFRSVVRLIADGTLVKIGPDRLGPDATVDRVAMNEGSKQ